MLHLLIPAAGESKRFSDAGFAGPKGLLEIEWRGHRATMLEHVIGSVGAILPTVIGIREADKTLFHERMPTHVYKTIEGSSGQAHTVQMMSHVCGANDEMLVINSDNAFDHALPMHMVNRARRMHASISALVFNADHERYGFVDNYPFFDVGAEKVPISNYALAGAFYFKSGYAFRSAWNSLINTPFVQAERYLSDMFRFFLDPKLAVLINRSHLHEWGTPESLMKDESCKIVK